MPREQACLRAFSIDVFDMMDQLAEIYEVQVALEELPQKMFRGADDLTLATFADGILDYFKATPRADELPAADA